MKKLILLILFISFANAVSINEIMYNPIGNDYDFEYIELKGEGNISGWYFKGIDYTFPENTTINGFMILGNTCYEEGEDNDFIDRYNLSCEHSYKGTLKNSGEEIVLYNSFEEIIDNITYEDKGEGFSVGKINGELKKNIGTPMRENIEYVKEIIKEEEIIEVNEEAIREETIIEIEYVKPDNVEWGDIVKVGFKVKNSQSGKYAIYGYIEDDKRVSEKVTIHIKDKGEYELMLPIQIKSNCNDKLEDGKYYVIIEGLGEKDKKRIEIEGKKKKMCKEIIIEEEKIIEKKVEVIMEKEVVKEKIIIEREGKIMESNDFAIKKMIPYFIGILFALSLIFSIVAFYNPINI